MGRKVLPGMQPLFMPLLRIAAPGQTPLMTRNAILMRLQTPVRPAPVLPHRQNIVQRLILHRQPPAQRAGLRSPPQGQVTRTHHLDKIHIVKRRIIGQLARRIQGIGMVIRPGHAPPAQPPRDILRHLRAKP